MQLVDSAGFQAAVSGAGDQLVVIDFFATWCGPCHRIAPFLDTLSQRYADAIFLKVDVDKSPDIAQAFEVTAMPTFLLLKSMQPVGKMSGANEEGLEQLIQQALAGGGGGAGGAGAAAGGDAGDGEDDCGVAGQVDLQPFIDKKQIECANAKEETPIAGALFGTGFLESDCDEQMIIAVTFNQDVKIHSLAFDSNLPGDVGAGKSGPKNVKIFINLATTPDFDDAESYEPVQALSLGPSDLTDAPVALTYVKFQNVRSLYLFIEDNQEDTETTVLSSLRIIGQTREAVNMSDFKRVSGKAGESDH